MAVDFLDDVATLDSTTVRVYRTATVVKGGRRFSWAAMVVVGDRQGSVGVGYGKATGVPMAVEKAQKVAKKNVVKVTLQEGTLPHQVTGRFGASMVRLIPAAPGTGVIAGATVRAVLELAGVRDCLTKAYGSTNQKNLCKAAMEGLVALRSKDEVARLRGVEIQASSVEEMLEAGRRYAPTATPPRTTPSRGSDKNKKQSGQKSGQKKRKSDNSQDTPVVAETAEATTAIEPTDTASPEVVSTNESTGQSVGDGAVSNGEVSKPVSGETSSQ